MQDDYIDDDTFPTEEELTTLRRVPAKIPLKVYTIAFVELCERLSYYGTTAVYSNFIAKKNPGTSTGKAINPGSDQAQPGALGLGKQVSFSLTTFNAFWVYCTPLLGAYIADTYLGRFKTIVLSVIVAEIGHIVLVASAAPSVIDKPHSALGAFVIGLLVMGLGTGTFKPNISPLIAEQIPQEKMRVETTKKGERVIIDPAITATRLYNWFYFFINVGAIVGQISMAYAERYVGFYLSFLIPTIAFGICLPVLYFCKNWYIHTPPSGSVMGPAFKLLFMALRKTPVKQWNKGGLWEKVRPSALGPSKPAWMTFDDAWVDEVARGFRACGVFFWMPIFWLAYRQMDSNLTNQAATMQLHGVPNDIISNLDPLSIIIIVPIMDILVYPAFRKFKINFSPVKKMTAGFIVASFAMTWAAVNQYYIYKTSGYYKTHDPDYLSPINVWVMSGTYVLIGTSEIFASVTTLEYAYTKAPKNMRSLVQAVALFTNAFSAALAQAWTPLTIDPLLVWNYASVAIIAFITGILFWFAYKNLDAEEDALNLLPTGHLGTTAQAEDVERRMSVHVEEEKKI
ncbi:POT family-domain-containing protein [Lophiotrema nucula]|uniref:POT family-domain-containing protein n=1 Tax=Lophiotrema nucula TaxID=690887 RepID=A0A6A5YUA2_9PLEO|nr:POT family-domain-containing protein [Lophiotrema nucula]